MLDRIVVEPGTLDGRPGIRGLRISVASLLRLIAAGWTVPEIREAFPFLEPDDIRQALLYGARLAEDGC
ncbi:DUF433 domain-containing protein [Pseudonocardiaceae bacterium YIM PH 21723]|nr:DUF433 domain-containing protein [Pseudonocardiaceae bacterium YIM PH 21723]